MCMSSKHSKYEQILRLEKICHKLCFNAKSSANLKSTSKLTKEF